MMRCRPIRRLQKPFSSPSSGLPQLGSSRMSVRAARTLRFRSGSMFPDQLPHRARRLEGSNRHADGLISKQFLDRIPFLGPRQPANTVANLLKEFWILQNLGSLVPAVIFLFAHDDRDGLPVPCDRDRFISALDDINDFAELCLHVG